MSYLFKALHGGETRKITKAASAVNGTGASGKQRDGAGSVHVFAARHGGETKKKKKKKTAAANGTGAKRDAASGRHAHAPARSLSKDYLCDGSVGLN